jgi:hypothetical protein
MLRIKKIKMNDPREREAQPDPGRVPAVTIEDEL